MEKKQRQGKEREISECAKESLVYSSPHPKKEISYQLAGLETRKENYMNQRMQPVMVFVVFIFVAVAQAVIIHQRDTLHILSKYGREISITNDLKFKVDSISPGVYSYPCSLSHTGIFFATNSAFPACPCCPKWSIGSPVPFFRLLSNITLSRPLILNDTNLFEKIDTFNHSSCVLPTAKFGDFLIFTNRFSLPTSTYLLVQVGTYYLNNLKPTETGGGDMGYPFETCRNMLVVDMYYQTDGSLDFSKANITSINSSYRPGKFKAAGAISSSVKVFDLQGHLILKRNDNTPLILPHACYFIKSGTRLEKYLF
jgi:hypothetical protein